VLLSAETVAQMKPGSVVIDLAAAQGGNCPLTRGRSGGGRARRDDRRPDQPARAEVAADASALYARNLLDFLKLVFD
jgi:NAD(P) transhydrogenase subunit alpha